MPSDEVSTADIYRTINKKTIKKKNEYENKSIYDDGCRRIGNGVDVHFEQIAEMQVHVHQPREALSFFTAPSSCRMFCLRWFAIYSATSSGRSRFKSSALRLTIATRVSKSGG